MALYPISREGIREFLELKKTLITISQEIKARGDHLSQVIRSNEDGLGYLYDDLSEYAGNIKKMEGLYDQAMAGTFRMIDRIVARIEELLAAGAEGSSGSSSVSSISSGNADKHGAYVTEHAEAVHDRPSARPSSSSVPEKELIHRMRLIDEKLKAAREDESKKGAEVSVMGTMMGMSQEAKNLLYSATGAGNESVLKAQYANVLEYGYHVEEKILGGGRKISEDRSFLEALSSDISHFIEQGNADYLTELQNDIARENPEASKLWQQHTPYENIASILFASMIGGERREELENYLPESSAWFDKNILSNTLEEGKKMVKRRENDGR